MTELMATVALLREHAAVAADAEADGPAHADDSDGVRMAYVSVKDRPGVLAPLVMARPNSTSVTSDVDRLGIKLRNVISGVKGGLMSRIDAVQREIDHPGTQKLISEVKSDAAQRAASPKHPPRGLETLPSRAEDDGSESTDAETDEEEPDGQLAMTWSRKEGPEPRGRSSDPTGVAGEADAARDQRRQIAKQRAAASLERIMRTVQPVHKPRTVWVGGIPADFAHPENVFVENLRNWMEPYGTLDTWSVRYKSREQYGSYKSYAVVTFVTAGGAKKAMESGLRVLRNTG